MTNLDLEIQLQTLITKREAMLAENQIRMYTSGVLSYGEGAFMEVVDQLKGLLGERQQRPTACHPIEDTHKKIHIKLHHYLDELIADYINWHPMGASMSDISVLDLLNWSGDQMMHPTVSHG